MAVPVRTQILTQLQTLNTRLTNSLYRLVDTKGLQLKSLSLPDLSETINVLFQKLDDRSERLHIAFQAYWQQINLKFETVSKLLKSYSYHSILERGFALISGSSGQIISHLADARREKRLQISFSDGLLNVTPTHSKSPKSLPSSLQGDLFDEK